MYFTLHNTRGGLIIRGGYTRHKKQKATTRKLQPQAAEAKVGGRACKLLRPLQLLTTRLKGRIGFLSCMQRLRISMQDSVRKEDMDEACMICREREGGRGKEYLLRTSRTCVEYGWILDRRLHTPRPRLACLFLGCRSFRAIALRSEHSVHSRRRQIPVPGRFQGGP